MELLNIIKIQNFIKWSIMELSTNTKIIHKNICYTNKRKTSLLIEKLKKK
jgi:hypothetical protein